MLFRNYEHCVFIKHKHFHSAVFSHHTRWFNVSKCNNPITACEFTLVAFKNWFLCYQFKKYNSYMFKTMFTIIQQWNWFYSSKPDFKSYFSLVIFSRLNSTVKQYKLVLETAVLAFTNLYPPCSSVYTDLFHKVIHLINKGM